MNNVTVPNRPNMSPQTDDNRSPASSAEYMASVAAKWHPICRGDALNYSAKCGFGKKNPKTTAEEFVFAHHPTIVGLYLYHTPAPLYFTLWHRHPGL